MEWNFVKIVLRIACIILISSVLSMVCTWVSIFNHDFYKMLSPIPEIVASVAYIILFLGTFLILIFCIVIDVYLHFKKKN